MFIPTKVAVSRNSKYSNYRNKMTRDVVHLIIIPALELSNLQVNTPNLFPL
jgi:hypothetical protein